MKKRLINLLLIVILILSCAYTISAENVSDLQSQQKQSEKKLSDAAKNQADTEKSKNDFMKEKEKTDKEKTEISAQMNVLKQKQSKLEVEISGKEKEIVALTQKEDDTNELFKGRMRTLYEDHSFSFIDIILGSKSIGDFFYRLDIMSQVAAYDKRIISEIQEQRTGVEDAKSELETKKSELLVTIGDYSEQEKSLIKKSKEEQALIDKFTKDMKAYALIIENEEKEIAAIQRQIRSLLNPKASSGVQYTGGKMQKPSSGSITSPFGMRTHPVTGVYKLHTGLDLGAPYGANISAAEDGTVIIATYNSAYGNYIVIDHGGGVSTLYAHSSALLVAKGDKVKRGDIIAKVGSTGYSTGAHLHFEVQINGNPVDPYSYIF